jgi:hypothetical protein
MTYAIMFMNEDTLKIGCDKLTAPSESAARHDFREVYRHANYKILATVPVPEKEETA